MKKRGIIAGIAAVALVATGVVVVPAFGATDTTGHQVKRTMPQVRSLGTFTPAAADPRLAAMFARGGLDGSGFRFTPAETGGDTHAVTVAVRARSNRTIDTSKLASVAAPTVGLAPIAYNLGVAVGWRRFALSGDVGHIDLAGIPGSRDTTDLAVSYTGARLSGRVKAAADKPLAGAVRTIEDMPSYSVDVGGSFALTHNFDVTAGLRYRSDRERLAPVEDNRRDSQAVYVGTAFRF